MSKRPKWHVRDKLSAIICRWELDMTRYEIAAHHYNGRQLLIGYTLHKSRPGLLAVVQKHAPEIIVVFGSRKTEEITIDPHPPHCCRIGEWRIVFTGRTQARANREGELPFFSGPRHSDPDPRGDARGCDECVREELRWDEELRWE
jgi:hypothetical protein